MASVYKKDGSYSLPLPGDYTVSWYSYSSVPLWANHSTIALHGRTMRSAWVTRSTLPWTLPGQDSRVHGDVGAAIVDVLVVHRHNILEDEDGLRTRQRVESATSRASACCKDLPSYPPDRPP